MATKKIGSAGRFGARHGKRIRTKVVEVEKKQLVKHICPYCKRKRVKRVAMGVYSCRKCGSKFTGLAYYPS